VFFAPGTSDDIIMKPAGRLAEVMDRLGANPNLSDTRKRDLRSAIVTYAKIVSAAGADIEKALVQSTQRHCRSGCCVGHAADAQNIRSQAG
jgi:hypothetical protein